MQSNFSKTLYIFVHMYFVSVSEEAGYSILKELNMQEDWSASLSLSLSVSLVLSLITAYITLDRNHDRSPIPDVQAYVKERFTTTKGFTSLEDLKDKICNMDSGVTIST